MARSSLWTPLIVILTIQLVLLVFLNLKTSAPTNTELLSVRISSSDPAALAGLRKTRGSSLVNIQSVVQIGAPANNLNGEQRNDEKDAALNENVPPQIDAPVRLINEAEQQRVAGDGTPVKDSAVERANENVPNENVPQIDAPGGDVIDNGAGQRVRDTDPSVGKKERERDPSDKERGIGVDDGRKGERAEKRREEKGGVVSVNRNELRKRSDDEQLVGEREKAAARGDRKGQLLQQHGELRGVPMSKEEQDGGDSKREEAVKDGDRGQTIDKKAERGRESVPSTGRRKMNQVSMLKARDPDRSLLAGDQNNNNKKKKKKKKKPLAGEEKEHALIVEKKAEPPLDNNNNKKSVQMDPSDHSDVKVPENATNKRPLIEKVSQLKTTRNGGGYGRLRNMPFMKARRLIHQQQLEVEEEGEERVKPGMKPPKFNQRQIDDLLKYSDKLNFFEEFCKEVAEPLVECGERQVRELTEEEKSGQNIMFTLRTTLDYHDKRLPVLFETWLSTVDPRTVFLVTDGEDTELDDNTENIGMHYINAQSGTTHSRTDLCCKAGVELELMFHEHNEAFNWLCHVDDDMYVNLDVLVNTLAKFDPKNEPVYFGRSGSLYTAPRTVKNVSKIGTPNASYHFAVGGMYCLSRSMLELARDYLVGCEAFSKSCQKALEPEDVTVGLVIGAVLNQELSRTEMIYTHGLDLMSSVPSPYISQQIAFSYGFGSVESWHFTPNVVYVPGAVFSPDDDLTQFRSIHCHIFPTLPWCVEKKRQLAAILEEIKHPGNRGDGKKGRCVCTWKTPMCCEVWKEAYKKAAEQTMKERLKLKEMEKEKKERAAAEFKAAMMPAAGVGEARLVKQGR